MAVRVSRIIQNEAGLAQGSLLIVRVIPDFILTAFIDCASFLTSIIISHVIRDLHSLWDEDIHSEGVPVFEPSAIVNTWKDKHTHTLTIKYQCVIFIWLLFKTWLFHQAVPYPSTQAGFSSLSCTRSVETLWKFPSDCIFFSWWIWDLPLTDLNGKWKLYIDFYLFSYSTDPSLTDIYLDVHFFPMIQEKYIITPNPSWGFLTQ